MKTRNYYNICISILEAKYLAWIDSKTYVEIEIDGKKKSTKVKECSDRPFFNEYFVFEVKKSLKNLMSTDIEISMYKPKGNLRNKTFLASTKLDIGTVWNRKDHQFYHEWFTLRHRAKEKGFLQCDIRIMSADSEPMHQLSPSFGRGLSLYKKDDIDGIIGVAVYFLRIYRGGDFYNFHQSKKHAKISVSITFCGITMKSSDQRDTVNPVWNEEFKILSPFPPVHYKLKLDLLINDKEVSSVGILMDELSGTHETLKGFLPTFGPAHKYFYSSHNTYLGYVIFSLETIEMRDGREDSKSSVLKRVQISGLVEEKHFGFQYFSCYCMIYEVSMLDKSLCLDQELTVSIELGREGRLAFNETNVTKPIVAEETEGNYCWLSFGRRKPCLFVKDNLPDTRWRLFMTNSLKRVCKKFDDKLFLVNNEDDTSQKTKIIIDALKVLKIDCESLHFINGSTQLDKDRMNFIKNLVSKISIEASRIIRGNNFKKMYNDTKVVLDDLKKFAKDPQDSLPSIIINIWKNNKRIYSCRIQPEDVIFANTQNFSGSSCGQLETVFMEKLPSKLSSRKNSAKLVACIWMGIQNDIAHWHDAFPGGLAYCSKFHSTTYEDKHPLSSMESSPTDSITSPTTEVPACIQYRNCFDCICHVYIEQAYFEDQSLFHKPSHNRVRVVFQNRSSETHEEFGMQQVVWSESLSTGPVTLYGDKHYFENHPEVIVVEVWQRKKKVSLVGNICLRAKLKRGDSVSKDLECHDIIQESTRVGKLFICAELIEIGEETEASFPKFDKTMFPSTSTAKYRLEVYFWGVRDLKYQSAKNICIKITVGKYSLSSSPLIIQKGSIYFTKQDIIVNDMILPKSKLIAPMMIINLIDTIEEDNRKEKIYKGCCSIADIHDKFEYCLITPDEWRQVQKFDKQNLISLRESFNYIDYSETHRKKSFFKKVAFKPPELLLDVLWLLKKAIFYVLDSVKKVFSKYQILDDNSWMHSENLAEPVLRVKKEGKHDWWSKYFNSKKLVEDLNNNGRMEGESITIYSTKNQPSLELYAGELENYFNGFTDCLKVFKLTQSKINEDPENKTFCKVKAAIVLYEVPQTGQKLFTRNGCPLDDSTPVLSSHVVASKNFPPSCDSSSSPLPLSPHLPSISPPIPASSLPPTSSQRLMLRFYIVQAFNLYAKHGQSLNPYISASVSSASVERFATYLTDQSNPCFGMSFELAAELPKDYELTVKVMNFVRFGKNELIGETKIDLENRFYTKHRARCGLQTSYETKGFNSWRDQLKPSDILENLCKENGLPAPLFLPNCIIVAGKEFIFSPLDTDSKEERSLNVLLRWEEIPIVGCKLVREHVETRPLYKPQYPGIIQGYIEMWVDMFDLSEPHPDLHPLPPLLDITPREPQAYELRVIIYKTCKVFLVDNTVSVGYKHSDIYVKGWMLGKADSQSTDVHHKSITGDGNFNWRFIFPFKYLSAEGCITPNADLQTSASSKKKSQLTKVPPRIYLQVCDKERLFSDQFIGLLSLDLRYMIKGATRWWLCQSHVDESPKNTLNLFEERKTRGWWPFYGSQRFRQRNKITGYLEAEFHLVNYLEALRSPVGYGRNEPDGLPDPKRKIVRFTFWLLPCRVFLHMIGLNKLTILFFLAISGVVLFVLLGIYAIPSTVVQRMIGGH